MKLRRYISIVVLTAYLLAIGGLSWSMITCPCVKENPGHALLCGICHAKEFPATGHTHVDLPDCCGHDHTASTELFVAGDQHRQGIRSATTPTYFLAQFPDTASELHLAARPFSLAVYPSIVCSDPVRSAVSLRAPPAQA